MGEIVPFPVAALTERDESFSLLTEPFLFSDGEEECFAELREPRIIARVGEIEKELLNFFHESMIASSCRHRVDGRKMQEEQETRIPELDALHEIVVFSPEIQQDKLVESSSNDQSEGEKSWGDVFVRIGDEYSFLFTLYTADYVRQQKMLYGEGINSSPRDVILKRPDLSPSDILRGLIKWVNLYRPNLMGRPIFLEESSILQSLICDPGVEVVWCEPT